MTPDGVKAHHEIPMNFDRFDQQWRLRAQPETLEKLLRELGREGGFEADWRWARAHHFAAMRVQQDGDSGGARVRFAAGREAAQRARQAQSGRVEGHFWWAVCALEAARLSGKGTTLRVLPGARKQLRRALSLDESFHCAGPHRVLGRLSHLAPRFWGGDFARARAHFLRALERCDNSTTRLYFGEFLRDRGETDAAREQFRAILRAPDDENWLWEQARDRTLARQHLLSGRAPGP